MPSRPIRVRMAPSPTGYVHLGSARTMLFDYLFARSKGGALVLRLEDTDVERNREEYETTIYDGFHWLGLGWDEGPEVGGPFRPYRQSERLDLYREAAASLLASGAAYRCYCTREELAAERALADAEKRPYRYSRRCLSDPPKDRREFTVRFKVPEGKIGWEDAVRGPIEFDLGVIGDFVIVRSDGWPLYNFSVAVDDAQMEITHVFRGEEHLSNTPAQLLVLDALGQPRPEVYGHLPVIIGKDRAKLSKRKHPEVRLGLYQELGYLPEAMVNYLALLGWNPGTEQEIFSLEELVQAFDIRRVQKSPAMFDWEKLDWLNGHYIRALDDAELARRLEPFAPELPAAKIMEAVPALKERLPRLEAARAMLQYLWVEPAPAELDDEARIRLRSAREALAGIDWTPPTIEAALEDLRERLGVSRNQLFGPIRTCITGSKVSPPIHHTLALLPQAEALARLDRCSP